MRRIRIIMGDVGFCFGAGTVIIWMYKALFGVGIRLRG